MCGMRGELAEPLYSALLGMWGLSWVEVDGGYLESSVAGGDGSVS